MDRFLDSKPWKKVDWWLLLSTLGLCLVGFIAITFATSSPYTGGDGSLINKIASLEFGTTIRQFLWFAAGFVAMVALALADYRSLKDISKWIYIVNAGILLALFGLATVTRRTVSWYRFGSIGFQPSEFCKISLILFLGKILCDHVRAEDGIDNYPDVMKPLVTMGIVFVLVMLQPDMGTAMVYLCTCLGMMLVVGVKWKIVGGLGALAGGMLPIMWFFVLDDRQRARIYSVFNQDADLLGQGYNVNYSKMAIGSGGFSGKGMFAEGAMNQLDWVPEKHTDFIFSAIGEAFGFVGCMVVILLYVVLIWRIIYIGMNAQNRFGCLICVGVASMLMAHIFENIAMTMGVMPVTGIPLPFISYGGSNMLTNMMAIGLVMSVKMRIRRQY
ncbi:MAG: rod shape-determining protein RodA [Clostridiales bacterium]|nr:rod shape-determining protein RodA [Clostridiales bacterium]